MSRIEYFYSAHSAYAYLGAWRLAEIAQAAGAEVIHKPVDLNPVLDALRGINGSRTDAHRAYFFGRDMFRWAEYRDLPMVRFRPTHHDNPLALPNGTLIAAQAAGADVDALARRIMIAHWRDDADLADPGTIGALLADLGMDANLLDAALSPDIQAMHAANTQEAIARSVFGSPTYFVDGDMFYGQDRLELVARALHTPFAP